MLYFLASSLAVSENVYGRKGSTYTFVCPHKKTTTNNVLWTFTNKTGTVISISDGTFLNPTNPAKDKVELVGDHAIGEYNLKLSDLQETDEGNYRCVVSVQLKEYFLELMVAPSALILYDIVDNRISGTEGQSLTVNCTAIGGKPPPDLRLNVDSQVISGTQSVQYTIPVLQRNDDEQLVTCEATSDALDSPIKKNTSLYLYLKPLTPKFNSDPPRTNDTQPLTVSCTSLGSRPAAVIYWKVKSIPVTDDIVQQNTTDPSTDTYTVVSTLTYSVDRSYNGQSITCGVTHQTLNQVLEVTKTISVQYAPDVTVSNKTHTQSDTTRAIQCTAVGNPSSYVYCEWKHMSTYGIFIRGLNGSDDGTLILPSVAESDSYQESGEYICTVSNGIGDKDEKIKMTGYGYMTVNAQPKYTVDNNDISTQYGEFGQFTEINVYVYSVPKFTNITWYKGNISLTRNDKYDIKEQLAVVKISFHGVIVQLDGYQLTLTISNLVEGDFTTYKLSLFNGYGESVEHSVFLESVNNQASSSAVVGGVVGGLVSVVVILVVIILVVVYKRTKGTVSRQNVKYKSKEEAVFQNQLNSDMYEEMEESTNKDDKQSTTNNDSSTKTYEPLGMQDKPNLYAELSDQENAPQSISHDNSTTNTYESSGMMDNPHLYTELSDQEGQARYYKIRGSAGRIKGCHKQILSAGYVLIQLEGFVASLIQKFKHRKNILLYSISCVDMLYLFYFGVLYLMDDVVLFVLFLVCCYPFINFMHLRRLYSAAEQYESLGAKDKPNVYEDLQSKKEKEYVNMAL